MAEYRVISGKDFIKAKPTGQIDLAESKKVLASIASITRPPADYEILLDIRDVNVNRGLNVKAFKNNNKLSIINYQS